MNLTSYQLPKIVSGLKIVFQLGQIGSSWNCAINCDFGKIYIAMPCLCFPLCKDQTIYCTRSRIIAT